MKEIKFRAWDTVREIMLPEFDLFDAITGSIGDCAENLEFLQYTGLKDKNNKAVYAGDICKDDEDDIGSVFYKDVEFVFAYGGEKRLTQSLTGNLEDEHRDSSGQLFTTYFEVIGNIYENASLLGKE